jgi:hypothetical protein
MSRNWNNSCQEGNRRGGSSYDYNPRGDSYNDEGLRDAPRLMREQFEESFDKQLGDAKRHGNGFSSASMEQKTIAIIELVFFVVVLIFLSFCYADIISQFGEEPTYVMGEGITHDAFDAAESWFIFFLTMAILQGVYLIAMIIYHFANADPTASQGEKTDHYWATHTRHYISALCSNALFRIVAFSASASFMKQVEDSSVRVTKATVKAWVLLAKVPSKSGNNSTEYDTVMKSNSVLTEANNTLYTEATGIINIHMLLVLVFSLSLMVLMVPRTIALMGKIVNDDEYTAHKTALNAAADEVDAAMAQNGGSQKI